MGEVDDWGKAGKKVGDMEVEVEVEAGGRGRGEEGRVSRCLSSDDKCLVNWIGKICHCQDC